LEPAPEAPDLEDYDADRLSVSATHRLKESEAFPIPWRKPFVGPPIRVQRYTDLTMAVPTPVGSGNLFKFCPNVQIIFVAFAQPEEHGLYLPPNLPILHTINWDLSKLTWTGPIMTAKALISDSRPTDWHVVDGIDKIEPEFAERPTTRWLRDSRDIRGLYKAALLPNLVYAKKCVSLYINYRNWIMNPAKYDAAPPEGWLQSSYWELAMDIQLKFTSLSVAERQMLPEHIKEYILNNDTINFMPILEAMGLDHRED